jgi:hypothetical protein
MKRRTKAPGEKAIAESASRKVKKDQPLTIDDLVDKCGLEVEVEEEDGFELLEQAEEMFDYASARFRSGVPDGAHVGVFWGLIRWVSRFIYYGCVAIGFGFFFWSIFHIVKVRYENPTKVMLSTHVHKILEVPPLLVCVKQSKPSWFTNNRKYLAKFHQSKSWPLSKGAELKARSYFDGRPSPYFTGNLGASLLSQHVPAQLRGCNGEDTPENVLAYTVNRQFYDCVKGCRKETQKEKTGFGKRCVETMCSGDLAKDEEKAGGELFCESVAGGNQEACESVAGGGCCFWGRAFYYYTGGECLSQVGSGDCPGGNPPTPPPTPPAIDICCTISSSETDCGTCNASLACNPTAPGFYKAMKMDQCSADFDDDSIVRESDQLDINSGFCQEAAMREEATSTCPRRRGVDVVEIAEPAIEVGTGSQKIVSCPKLQMAGELTDMLNLLKGEYMVHEKLIQNHPQYIGETVKLNFPEGDDGELVEMFFTPCLRFTPAVFGEAERATWPGEYRDAPEEPGGWQLSFVDAETGQCSTDPYDMGVAFAPGSAGLPTDQSLHWWNLDFMSGAIFPEDRMSITCETAMNSTSLHCPVDTIGRSWAPGAAGKADFSFEVGALSCPAEHMHFLQDQHFSKIDEIKDCSTVDIFDSFSGGATDIECFTINAKNDVSMEDKNATEFRVHLKLADTDGLDLRIATLSQLEVGNLSTYIRDSRMTWDSMQQINLPIRRRADATGGEQQCRASSYEPIRVLMEKVVVDDKVGKTYKISYPLSQGVDAWGVERQSTTGEIAADPREQCLESEWTTPVSKHQAPAYVQSCVDEVAVFVCLGK